jgi:hypothetical protein
MRLVMTIPRLDSDPEVLVFYCAGCTQTTIESSLLDPG